MKPYIAIVHKDEHSAYGITFPDAPGCFSAADEIDGVFPMAGEALELWAEGMAEDGHPIPAARDFEALRADAYWAQRFTDAAFVIAVPPPATQTKRAA